MHNLSVGVFGASGYAGRELCALVAGHPNFRLAFATANERRGQKAVFGATETTFLAAEDAPLNGVELIFSALPHGSSAPSVKRAREAGARVVDLSQDLRPGTGEKAVPYGLPELFRSNISGAELVANPGCYPTAILTAIAPLLASDLVTKGTTINVSAASGVTGAGASPKPELQFAEVAENFRAYAVGNSHRHLVEVREVVKTLGGDLDVLFTPHLLPVTRGILATITLPLKTRTGSPADIWRKFYRGEPFIRIVEEPPALRDVAHGNSVAMSVQSADNLRQPTLVIIAAIDNLVKGAAGQAVQNANLMLGIPETTGLVA